MLTRTRSSTIEFRHPFALKSLGHAQPAGIYDVEIEEELVEGLSFPVYRRVATTLTARTAGPRGHRQAWAVDPRELERAQAADGAGSG